MWSKAFYRTLEFVLQQTKALEIFTWDIFVSLLFALPCEAIA
jgi:hypothetical protein